MKKIYLLVPLVLFLFAISGCVSNDNILKMARDSPTIKEFLSEYPNAEISLLSLAKADIEKDADFLAHCPNVRASDYYKAVISDVPSGLKAFAFISKDTGVACAFKEAAVTCAENWSCTNWSPDTCPASKTQTRVCVDANNCGTSGHKPVESKTCSNLATNCSDSDNGLDYFVSGRVTVKNSGGTASARDACLSDIREQEGSSHIITQTLVDAGIVNSSQLDNPDILIESYCPSSIPGSLSDMRPFEKAYLCPSGCQNGACL